MRSELPFGGTEYQVDPDGGSQNDEPRGLEIHFLSGGYDSARALNLCHISVTQKRIWKLVMVSGKHAIFLTPKMRK